jgi:hypothetical protein
MSMRNGDKARTANQKRKTRALREKLRMLKAQKKTADKKQSGS